MNRNRVKWTNADDYIQDCDLSIYLQRKSFIPDWIEACFDCFSFLFYIIRIWYELELYIRIAESIWIHRNEISSLFHYKA